MGKRNRERVARIKAGTEQPMFPPTETRKLQREGAETKLVEASPLEKLRLLESKGDKR